MATISTNVYDNSKFELRITPTADNANLRYKLSWEIWLVISGGNYWEYNAVRINNAKINGTQVKGSETFSYYYGPGSWKLASGTTYVAYNSDGSDVKVSASISGWFYADGDVSGSGTVTCTGGGVKPTTNAMTAPSTAVISETSSTISVTWNKMSSYNNAGTYTLQVSQNGSAYADVTTISAIGTLSYSYSIPNKGQGTTYRFRIRANNNIGSGDWQYSGTVTINSLSPPTIGTLGTFNPYVNTTFNVPLSGGSQANGGGFKRCANIHVDGNYKYAGTAPSSNGNTSVNITVSAANILADLGANSYSSSTKFTIVAWIENANGTRSSYVSKSFTVNINSDGGATPSIGTISVSGGALSNPTTCFISGITTMGVSVSSVAARRGHANTTVACKINYDSTNKNGTSASFASNTTGARTITVTATDSRGLSSSKTYQVRVQSWAKPTIKITSVSRLSDPNTSATLNYSITYSPIYQYTDVNTAGNQLNGVTSQQYNLNGSSWVTASNGMTITGLGTELAYTINVRCNDKVSTSSYGSDKGTIPSIQVELSIRKGRVGVGGVPQSGFVFESYGKSRVNNDDFIVTNADKLQQMDGKTGVVIHGSGGIEISHESTPYIDFHYANSTADYTTRIVEDSSGRLSIRGSGFAVGKKSEGDNFDVGLPAKFREKTVIENSLAYRNAYVARAQGGNGQSGYIKGITIKLKGSYANATMVFEYIRRAEITSTKIYVRFNDTGDHTDFNQFSLLTDGLCDVYAIKSSTSTLDIYFPKIEHYDDGTIVDARISHYMLERVDVTYPNEFVSTLPSGYKTSSQERYRRGYPIAGTFDGLDSILTKSAETKSFIGSMYSDTWYNVLSIRHRNGISDGNAYGLVLYSNMITDAPISFRKQYGGVWGDRRILLDSENYTSYCATPEDLVASPLLWSGALYMNAGHSITLSQAISAQKSGIVLCWNRYANGATTDYDWTYTFISKRHISNANDKGVNCTGSVTNSGGLTAWNKYLYIKDTQLRGHANNTLLNSSIIVLRYVYGV